MSKFDIEKLKNVKKPWFCVSCAGSTGADTSRPKTSVPIIPNDKEDILTANLSPLGHAIETLIQKTVNAILQRMADAFAQQVKSFLMNSGNVRMHFILRWKLL